MRFIPTRVHGLLDYLVAAVLIALPWAGGFAGRGAETWLPVVLGGGVIGYSLLTDYEWGLRRVIPVPNHLLLDLGGGILLAASPWLFAFADRVWVPHLLIGLFETAAALTTRLTPGAAGATGPRPSAAGL